MVSFTLRQVTNIVDGPKYEVINEITAAVDASPAVYVFKTVNQEYSNYASAADMMQWPDSYEMAQISNLPFYRLSSLTRTWDTVQQMQLDLSESIRRLQSLADELNAQQGELVIDRTTVIVGG